MYIRMINIQRPTTGRRAGFTAIEIAMVATVVAILALIILPIFRSRVEEAKLARTKADLNSLMKAQQLAEADTSFYLRLEDLDNNASFPDTAPTNGIAYEMPHVRFSRTGFSAAATPPYRRSMSLTERQAFSRNFKGPYIAFQDSLTYAELRNALSGPVEADDMLRSTGGNADSKPIQDYPSGSGQNGLYDSDDNRYPIDPWGNPYLFYAPTGNEVGNDDEQFGTSVIYSLGPDGMPGDGVSGNPAAYLRETGILGTGDDLMVQF